MVASGERVFRPGRDSSLNKFFLTRFYLWAIRDERALRVSNSSRLSSNRSTKESMSKRGVAGVVAIALLIIGVFVGTAGYYVASTYQTKTITLTQTTTQQETQIQTSISTSTSVVSSTTTQTSFVTSTSTTSIYPVPTNVTVSFTNPGSGYSFSYQIVAGTQNFSGSSGSPISIPVSPVFPGEQIKITASVGGNCSGGNSVTIFLYIDEKQISTATSGCNATPAQISTVL